MEDPQSSDPGPEPVALEQLDYFMVRIRRSAPGSARACAGIVERLGTGEKRSFRSSDELVRAVEEWFR